MFRNKSVSAHSFAMVPRADVPRSGFTVESSYKTTFDSGYLVPIYCEEILPGDTFNVKATLFARLATPIVPIMDNLHLETFFFFVPNRLVWENWQKFCGEQANPTDTTDYLVPTILAPVGGYDGGTLFDYFGLPTKGQVISNYRHSALPLRAYNLIYNEWFRDQNLQNSLDVPKDDGPDQPAWYALRRRGKRHDYFTSCLPWVQKGLSVTLPLGSTAPVYTNPSVIVTGARPAMTMTNIDGSAVTPDRAMATGPSGAIGRASGTASQVAGASFYPDNLYADLSSATAATINQIRQAFQIQKLLERDARGGTRYIELVKAHFGVMSPDARLQRPEYLGGGRTPIHVQPVAQTSGTAAAAGYTPTPQGNLSAFATALARNNGFSQSFTEHGYVIGLVSVRADLNYQQGLRKHWSRQTRFDFYWPVFSHLGEQAVLNKEIYCTGEAADDDVFGYQERWGEYRYKPSEITSLLRSTAAQPLDVWHLAQHFVNRPTLNGTFIEDNPPVDRVIATTEQTGQQFVLDAFFKNRCARPLPMYGVPGLVDHF